MTTRANHGLVDLIDGYLQVPEVSAPGTPASAKVRIYAKSDGHIYIKDDAGTEYDLTAALNGVTAASVLADNEVPKIDGASRAVQPSGLYLDDVGVDLKVRTANAAGATTPLVLQSGNSSGGDSGNAIFDVGTAAGTPGVASFGAYNAESVTIGRSSKNSQVNGTLGVTGAATCSSTLASGAQTITQATVGTVFRTEISTATNDDPTEKFYHGRATSTEDGIATLFSFAPAADERYTIETTVNVRQTAGTGTGTGRTIKIIADIQNIGGAVTVTIVSNVAGGTLAVNSCTVTTLAGNVTIECQVEGIVGSGKTYVHHAKIALFGPVGT